MGPWQVLLLRDKVNLGVMVMMESSTVLSSPEMEPHQRFSLVSYPRHPLRELQSASSEMENNNEKG